MHDFFNERFKILKSSTSHINNLGLSSNILATKMVFAKLIFEGLQLLILSFPVQLVIFNSGIVSIPGVIKGKTQKEKKIDIPSKCIEIITYTSFNWLTFVCDEG